MKESIIQEKINKLRSGLDAKTQIDDSNAGAVSGSTTYSASKIEERLSEIPSGGVEEAPIDGNQYARKDAGWEEVVAGGHTQNTDTNLGTLGTKNPPIDADKVIYRDSADSDNLKTSTWTQIKAFLKTYFDTIYQAVGTYLTSSNISDTAYNATSWDNVTTIAPSKNVVRDKIESVEGEISSKADASALANYEPVYTNYELDDVGETITGNSNVFINQRGTASINIILDYGSPQGTKCFIVVQNIEVGSDVVPYTGDALNGSLNDLHLTDADNGSCFAFIFNGTYWYEIL